MAGVSRTGGRTSVAVVDDDENIRLCFADILAGSKSFMILGSFSNAFTALAAIPQLRPDFVLMDIRLPDLDGVETTERLMRLMPCLKIVIVTGNYGQSLVEACMRAGAVEYLLKPVIKEQLVATLRFASHPGKNISDGVEKEHDFRANDSRSPANPILSPRENEVLACFADGLLYKEVSEKLGISYSAVHKYQHSAFKKLHAGNRSEAIRNWSRYHRS